MKANINKLRSDAMERAWYLYRSGYSLNFDVCLRKGWQIAKTWAQENYSRIAVSETKSADEYMIDQYNKNVAQHGADYANNQAANWV